MTDKGKYINVADVKRKLRYIFKAYGVGGFVREKVEVMIDNLPYSVKGDLETTLEAANAQSMDDMKVKETELKAIDVDVRGYTNRFECQLCLAEIYSEICLKNSDYEYCPYCGRKIKD